MNLGIAWTPTIIKRIDFAILMDLQNVRFDYKIVCKLKLGGIKLNTFIYNVEMFCYHKWLY